MHPPTFQPALFEAGEPSFDPSLPGRERIALDERSWLDLVPSWVQGSDALFEQIVRARKWKQRARRMYDRQLLEPRLTAPWSLRSGLPLLPPLIEEMRQTLSRQYGV